ncbi:LysR family transcriptional regulator [Alteromonas gracilis]|uniref:LysR family transcriptional regulator n=1 Tax=Alteromonas gracilis TaxID=1479524 RepID=UPI00373602D8
MDIEDVRKFLVVAKYENLHLASQHLALTTGALSKVIKRLENKLQTQLFDRVGRHIHLNLHGEKFQTYATHIVYEADQAISEFRGAAALSNVSIAGPSLLLKRYLPLLLQQFKNSNFHFQTDACWEGKALENVSKGHSDLAIVTSFAMSEHDTNETLNSMRLGKTKYVVVAAEAHPLFNAFPTGKVTINALKTYGFACPDVSPFCGIKRGVGSDGWRDNEAPRTIRYRCNDFSTLLAIVESGLALAYVPDFVATKYNLKPIQVTDYKVEYEEAFELVYKPSIAFGWLNRFVDELARSISN